MAEDDGPDRARVRGQRSREHLHAYLQRRDDYGLCMALIVATILSLAVAGDEPLGTAIAVSLSGATLIAVLVASGTRPRVIQVAAWVVLVAVLGSVLALLGFGGGLGHSAAGIIGLSLAILAPAVILHRIIRSPVITFRLVLGALCIYLLIGLAYTYLFPLVGLATDGPFFVQTTSPLLADYLYFSYTSLTTVGYGDFTAATSVGRMVAISEALVGQLYLVSAVALLVGNIGRRLTPKDEP